MVPESELSEPELATRMSGLWSWLMSATAIQRGLGPVGMVT